MRRNFYIITIFLFILLSCTRKIYKEIYPTLTDGKYDSEFPYRNCSKQLEEIIKSVKMINSVAYYKSYVFSESSKVENITDNIFKDKAKEIIYFDNAVSGTATIIYHQDNKIALLTCAHTVNFPDTIISYYNNENSYIQSISIKDRQSNYVSTIPNGGDFDILISDDALDVAILGKEIPNIANVEMPVFNYPIGKAKELEWGTFVYLIGYPMGNKMVTKGIVSSPNKDGKGSFLIDAPFNRGLSGGIVLAIRDGVPNFELVGMAKSAAADYEYLIIPDRGIDKSGYNQHIPYNGEIYVKLKDNIKYGITNLVSIDVIIDFINKNEKKLIEKGYDFRGVFDVNKNRK